MRLHLTVIVPIPKGLRPPAQGCDSSRRSPAKAEERATVGTEPTSGQTLKGFRHLRTRVENACKAAQMRRAALSG